VGSAVPFGTNLLSGCSPNLERLGYCQLIPTGWKVWNPGGIGRGRLAVRSICPSTVGVGEQTAGWNLLSVQGERYTLAVELTMNNRVDLFRASSERGDESQRRPAKSLGMPEGEGFATGRTCGRADISPGKRPRVFGRLWVVFWQTRRWTKSLVHR
jgi:hypothetical protein